MDIDQASIIEPAALYRMPRNERTHSAGSSVPLPIPVEMKIVRGEKTLSFFF